jgi:hypothetical protein
LSPLTLISDYLLEFFNFDGVDVFLSGKKAIEMLKLPNARNKSFSLLRRYGTPGSLLLADAAGLPDGAQEVPAVQAHMITPEPIANSDHRSCAAERLSDFVPPVFVASRFEDDKSDEVFVEHLIVQIAYSFRHNRMIHLLFRFAAVRTIEVY